MNRFFSRRQWLQSGIGAGSLALQGMLSDAARGSGASRSNGEQDPAMGTAKRVIFLFMAGGPSQVDTFDPKPELAKLAGQDVPPSLAQHVPAIKRAGLKNLMASPWEFTRHGESGLPVSSILPHTAKWVDQLCVIRSMTHSNPVHGPGECVALTGTGIGNRPSLGAWSIYGLGHETQELPAYVAMNLHTDGMQHPQAAGWGPGFLPSQYQATVVDPNRGIQFTQMPAGVAQSQRLEELRAIEFLNRKFLQSVQQHSELEGRIRSYELAFQMQSTAPELFEIDAETPQTHRLYGLDHADSRTVGRACLLARRMAERGVRFIQLRVGGWDAHGNLKANHERLAARTDQPIAALLQDLQQRGMLESTLVVWAGEFGRTPTMEGRGNGRDHSPAGYSIWLAGGGVRGGQIVGQTDPIGYTVTERPVSPQALHATILHALGIKANTLTFDHHGLTETPSGVSRADAVQEVFG